MNDDDVPPWSAEYVAQSQITVSRAGRGRGGRRKLWTFRRDHHAQWVAAIPVSSKQIKDPAIRRALSAPYQKSASTQAVNAVAARQQLSSLGVGADGQLGAGPIHLAGGVDPPASVLKVILEALYLNGRSEVDLRDVARILSELGKMIAASIHWDQETRQHAEAALHAEILRRCTNL